MKRSGNKALKNISQGQLLRDTSLTTDNGMTYAALILLGKPGSLQKHLPQAEVIVEYRFSEASIDSSQRAEYRKGFFLYFNELWEKINLRNETQSFRDGLFFHEVSSFNEVVIREAILNAVAHRDYRMGGSIFMWPMTRIETNSG